MIKSVKVTNFRGESIDIPMSEAGNTTGLLIKSITGLGPVKANINTTELATRDGSIYNSSRAESRNIVLTFIFKENPTIEDTRQMTYKYFPIKKKLTLTFYTDNREVKIDGYVESNEPNIWSQLEETQISIICPNPWFVSTSDNTVIFSGTDPMFEFPFENESNTPTIEMGEIKVFTSRNIPYDGDVDAGMLIYIHMMGPVTNPKIYNLDTREVMTINSDMIEKITGKGLVLGDDIIINTNDGEKSVILLREGVTYNVLNAIDRTSKWFKLSKGDNLFAWTVETGSSFIQFKISNNVLYEGI